VANNKRPKMRIDSSDEEEGTTPSTITPKEEPTNKRKREESPINNAKRARIEDDGDQRVEPKQVVPMKNSSNPKIVANDPKKEAPFPTPSPIKKDSSFLTPPPIKISSLTAPVNSPTVASKNEVKTNAPHTPGPPMKAPKTESTVNIEVKKESVNNAPLNEGKTNASNIQGPPMKAPKTESIVNNEVKKDSVKSQKTETNSSTPLKEVKSTVPQTPQAGLKKEPKTEVKKENTEDSKKVVKSKEPAKTTPKKKERTWIFRRIKCR